MPWTQQEECQIILPEIRQRLNGSFPDKTTDMVKTQTNCLIFILTTVILGSEYCFIYKQIASDLMVQIFNETKPLQYLQLDLPIQIIRKIFKRIFNLFKNTCYERVGAVFLNSQWTKLHNYFLVLLNNFLTWPHPCLLFWEQCSPESLQVTMVYTAESLPDNLYTGLDIQPG